jgi:hypothetical protein
MLPTLRRIVPLLCAGILPVSAAVERPLDYNRDVRPILSEHCFHCHGQDAKERKGKLRLDERDAALAVRDGHAAIVPGKPDASEAIKRMRTSDADDLMPPPEAKRPLTPEQITIVSRWIAEGAPYDKHWSFTAPRPVPVPATGNNWATTDLDHFIAARLASDGLAPAPAAEPGVWLRRASLDLTGLPVEPGDLQIFLADVTARGEAAYVAAVDRLLASPRYGERLAQDWLDAARYADTHGFNNDSTRSMWRWRDWVINAYNNDLPYDRFLTLQLAGDLVPGASTEDRIATGFNRNHVINSEGGIIDEEYRVEYVADRVRTMGVAMLGLSLECARCHDHKYDPISQRDYYALFAAFNQVDEHGEDGRVANARPLLASPTPAQAAELAALRQVVATTDAELTQQFASEVAAPWAALAGLGLGVGDVLDRPAIHLVMGDEGLVNAARRGSPCFAKESLAAHSDPVLGAVIDPGQQGAGLAGEQIDLGKPWTMSLLVQWKGGSGTLLSTIDWRTNRAGVNYGSGNEILVLPDGAIEVRRSQMWPTYAAQVVSETRLQRDLWQHLVISSDGSRAAAGVRVYIDGDPALMTVLHDDLGGSVGGLPRLGGRKHDQALPFPGQLADVRLHQRVLSPSGIAQVADAAIARVVIATPDPKRATWARLRVARERDAAVAARWAERAAARAAAVDLLAGFPTTMVMEEMSSPRPTHVLTRGRYDAPAAEVSVDVPAALGLPWPSDAPRNRLGLARWLTDARHPLTARVAVNRLWQQLFGTGLVKTSEDFGLQGEYPSHPDLLDHLARRFVAGGWRIKPLLKELVLSATYRQAARRPAGAAARDPENRLLAGSPRYRLSAEVLRDQALALGGLLRNRLGGPSVFPYQPQDLYKTVVVDAPYPGTEWLTSSGDDLFRRSLYTFWKRTVTHPVMTTFDAPDRESCIARRARTATPLQALVLLNEPGYVEAARGLGTRLLREGGQDDAARLRYAVQLVAARTASSSEVDILQRALARQRAYFSADAKAARDLLAVGTVPPDPAYAPAELAAWSMIGSLLLTWDAVVVRE